MQCRGGSSSDKERHADTCLLQLAGYLTHLLKRWRNKTTQADEIDLLLTGSLDNLLGRDHNAEVDNLKVVTRQHHSRYILTNIVNISLDRSQQITTVTLCCFRALRLDMWLQNLHGTLHRAGRLDHLRKEHLTLAKKLSYQSHTLHQRALDNLRRVSIER